MKLGPLHIYWGLPDLPCIALEHERKPPPASESEEPLGELPPITAMEQGARKTQGALDGLDPGGEA